MPEQSTLFQMVALSQPAMIAIAMLLVIFLLLRAFHRQRSTTLKRPPLRLLLRVAKFLFSQRTYEIVFKTLQADINDDYHQALQRQQHARATWIVLKGNFILLATILRQIVDPIYELIDRVKKVAG